MARPRLTLLASVTTFTLVVIGTTGVNVALPAIRADLGGGTSALQWVINAYALMLASLLLSMGALCDQRGARRVLRAGLALFAAGATASALAPMLGVLIAAQFVLGTAAAALLPASLALLSHAHPDDTHRAHAITLFASASAVSIGLGPVVGGLLIEAFGWRAVFVADVPLVAFVALLVARGVEETPRRPATGLDLPGQVSGVIALAAATFAIIHSGTAGWAGVGTLGPLALAVLAGALFVQVERRGAAPMLPLSLFSSRTFDVAAIAGLLVNFAVYGLFFVLSLYLQEVRLLTPLETGLAFLAQPLTAAAVTLPAGRLTARAGPRIPVAAGGLIGAAGCALLLTVGAGSPLTVVVLALALIGVGGGLTIPPLTTTVIGEAPRDQVGVATATFTTSRQAGGILGVAILGAMVNSGALLDGLHAAVLVAGGALLVTAAGGALLLAPRAHRVVVALP